ncbi:lipopolysaccharide export system permease protein [Litorimonas taeanensis]|uniref:Lipopolysaccharide export system permease protein n=1 Tax=Litorimonas taeanensis TaxID=568099 RepID=A0A420WIF6_9PROT|nr:LptF/LptG family permease [Litorimonas taeanensis]RKQ70788.1 lipopolysaccharide export system permease protein [Litorimonas taeanensis]
MTRHTRRPSLLNINHATLLRYISGRVFRAIFIAFLVVTSIIILVDFVENSRSLDAEFGSRQLAILTLLKAPSLIEETIPFIVLFGVIGALYGLNKSNEIMVMRAAGLSAWRFLSPVILISALIGLGWALVFNPLASDLMTRHDVMQDELGGGMKMQSNDIWLREGDMNQQTVIRANAVDFSNRTLLEATFYQMDVEADGRTVFARRFDAKTATLSPQGYWLLTNATENIPGEIKKDTSTLSLPTQITTRQFQDIGQKTKAPPFWDLPATIQTNEMAGFSALGLKMQYNKLLALPVLLMAMSIIAAGVSLRLSRQGGTFQLLVAGTAIGFLLYFIDSIVATFGEAGLIPVILAAWAMPIFALLVGISYLSKIEDG